LSIDFDLTAEKEVRNQAELHRILNNVRNDVGFYKFTFPKVRRLGWNLDEVLIEATILDDESKQIGEADLVLMVRDGDGNREPLLVIEVKKRVLSSLTRPFQNGFKQAWKYAQPIDCKFYAVYDGHFMITMQRSSPFLIGMCEFPISSGQERKAEFARNLWYSLLRIKENEASGPVEELCGVLNYPRWKRTIRFLIRDAYQRFYDDVISDEDKEEIAAVWDKRNL
jgi:hypothetical protein